MNIERIELTGALAGVTYGKQVKPVFACVYGDDGVGKSTFAAGAPNPVFLGTETGSSQLEVARLPKPGSIGAFLAQVDALTVQPHPFESVVLDSLDWLEPLIWRQVCAEGGVESIEKYEKGYGKGYTRALEIWRGVLQKLETLAQRFHVVLVAHARIKKFDDPTQSSGYDRYQIAVNDLAAAAVRQTVDVVLFATFRAKIKMTAKDSARGVGDGERVMYTEHRPAFDAKNRFDLPFEMKLEWVPFAKLIKAFYEKTMNIQDPAPFRAEPVPESVAVDPALNGQPQAV